jgi:hypothetical protein
MRSAIDHHYRMRKLDRLNDAVARVLTKMRGGQPFHLKFESNNPVWRLSGGERIDSQVAQLVTLNRNVVAAGDCLFAGARSQVYRFTDKYQERE